MKTTIIYGSLRRESHKYFRMNSRYTALGIGLSLGRNALRATSENKAERMAKGEWGYVEHRDDGYERRFPYACADFSLYVGPLQLHGWMNNENSCGSYWTLNLPTGHYNFLTPSHRPGDMRRREHARWTYLFWKQCKCGYSK